MDHTRYGNMNFSHRLGNEKPIEGKIPDFEQCDSGFDSYNPSLQSFDSDTRSNSYQLDGGISTRFSGLSVTTAESTRTTENRYDDPKTFAGLDERFDSGYNSISITSESGYLSIPEATSNAPTSKTSQSKEELQEVNTNFYLPDADGDTFLQLAILHSKVDAAFDMIQSCTNPEFLNIGNENEQTALHFSVLMDLPQITRCLVAYGADVRCKDRNGNTPLHIACERGLLGQIEMLTAKLEKEENPGLQKLTLPQDVNAKNYSGCSPLHLAVLNNQYDVVYKLARELKCSINQPDEKSGRTALHFAIEAQNYRMAQLLVEKKADVNALTYDEYSPLHFAVARGLMKETELLLRHHADLYLITRDDLDVFELSMLSKNPRRMGAFLKAESDKRQKKRSHRGIN